MRLIAAAIAALVLFSGSAKAETESVEMVPEASVINADGFNALWTGPFGEHVSGGDTVVRQRTRLYSWIALNTCELTGLRAHLDTIQQITTGGPDTSFFGDYRLPVQPCSWKSNPILKSLWIGIQFNLNEHGFVSDPGYGFRYIWAHDFEILGKKFSLYGEEDFFVAPEADTRFRLNFFHDLGFTVFGNNFWLDTAFGYKQNTNGQEDEFAEVVFYHQIGMIDLLAPLQMVGATDRNKEVPLSIFTLGEYFDGKGLQAWTYGAGLAVFF